MTDNRYATAIPPLQAEEYDALKADIRAHGVQVPVAVDEDGNILDGWHRAKIARELGITAPTQVIAGLSDLEKRCYPYKAQNARRNLLPAQKTLLRQRMIALAQELNQEGKSQAEIGLALGVARTTVSTWFRRPQRTPTERIDERNVNERNDEVVNTFTPRDMRETVDDFAREMIAQQVADGAQPAVIAEQYGITPQRVGQIHAERQEVWADTQRRQMDDETFTWEEDLMIKRDLAALDRVSDTLRRLRDGYERDADGARQMLDLYQQRLQRLLGKTEDIAQFWREENETLARDAQLEEILEAGDMVIEGTLKPVSDIGNAVGLTYKQDAELIEKVNMLLRRQVPPREILNRYEAELKRLVKAGGDHGTEAQALLDRLAIIVRNMEFFNG